ncbi:phosphatase PAP2 family protein [Streptomyces sp. NPDC051577]|uniref:phosphatase PAP2 family protein n=1 Tax=Streptomyces sp. NPDC051577 TaxID=3155166 RepID=UPI003434F67F
MATEPSWAGTALEAAGEGTLLFLGLLLAWVGWTALRRRDVSGLAGVAVTAAGTVVAYGLSEAIKLLVDEERPCRALPGVAALAPCPEPGDWSFPSNHATLAIALAVGVTLARPRLATLVLPVAGAAALLRVLVGVHYPHDVLAATVLGATAVVTVRLLVQPIAVRAVSAFLVRQPVGRHRDHAGLVRDHGGRGPVVDAEAGEDRNRGQEFSFALVDDRGVLQGRLGGLHLREDSPFTGFDFTVVADPHRARAFHLNRYGLYAWSADGVLRARMSTADKPFKPLVHFALLECTPAGELLLAHRKQRLLLRVPVPQNLDDLAPAVEAVLKDYGRERTALKKQYAPVNWLWSDSAAAVNHL